MITMTMVTSYGREITFTQLGRMAVRLGTKSRLAVMKELVKGAHNIKMDIKRRMRESPVTGRTYYRNGRHHTASSPGNPPRVDTGRLIQSIFSKSHYASVEVGTTIESPLYPLFLEKGTTRMRKRPWLGPPVRQWQPVIKAHIIRVVNKRLGEFGK